MNPAVSIMKQIYALLLILSLIAASRGRSPSPRGRALLAAPPLAPKCQDELDPHPEVHLRPSMTSTNISRIMENYQNWTNASFSVELSQGTYNRTQFAAILDVNVCSMTVGAKQGDYVTIDCGDIGRALPVNSFCFVSLELVNCALEWNVGMPYGPDVGAIQSFLHHLTMRNSAMLMVSQKYSLTAKNITITQSSGLPPSNFRSDGLLASIVVRSPPNFVLDGVVIKNNRYAAFVYDNEQGLGHKAVVDIRNVQITDNNLDAMLTTRSANPALIAVLVGSNGSGTNVAIKISNVNVHGNRINDTNPDLAMNVSTVLISGCPGTHIFVDSNCKFHNNSIISLRINETDTASIQAAFSSNTITPLILRDARQCTVSVDMTDNKFQTSLNSTVPVSAGIYIRNSSVRINKSNFSSNFILTSNGSIADGACINTVFPADTNCSIQISDSDFTACQIRLSRNALPRECWNTYSGGSISLQFESGSYNCSASITSCTFNDGVAARGGAVSVTFQKNSDDNHVSISGSHFNGNNASGVKWGSEFHRSDIDTLGTGGAISVVYAEGNSSNNFTMDGDCRLILNSAAEGGALYAWFNMHPRSVIFDISSSYFWENTALTGAAIYMSATSMLIQQDGSVASNNVVLHDVEIHANRAYYCGCIAAISIVFQIKGKMNYHGNYNSALYLESSYVNLMGYSTYYDNSAHDGAGIFSIGSHIYANPGSKSNFTGNKATCIGGAIFAYMGVRAAQNSYDPTNPRCFLLMPEEDAFEVVFSENVAGIAGSAIYLNDIMPCATTQGENPIEDPTDTIMWRIATRNMTETNTISPRFYHDYLSWTVYQHTPGGSLGILRKPQGNRWSDDHLVFITNFTERYVDPEKENSTINMTDYRINTDVWKLIFLKEVPDFPEDLPLNGECDYLLSERDGPEETVTYTSFQAGLGKELYAYACDRLKAKTNALLGFSIDKPRDRFGYPQHNCLNESMACPSLMLANASGTLRLSCEHQLCKTDPITFIVDNSEHAKVENIVDQIGVTTLTVQVVGSSNSVSAKIKINMTYCPVGYHLKENKADSTAKCVCSASTDAKIRDCDDGELDVIHGYWLGVNPTNPFNYNTLVCPSGYCQCHNASCAVNTASNATRARQCKDRRSGTLCAQCGPGNYSVLDIIAGACTKCPNETWARPISISVGAMLALQVIVLGLNVPLSNDIKGLFFYHSVIFLLPYPSDPFLDWLSSDKGTHPFWDFVKQLWALACFSLPDPCFYPLGEHAGSVMRSLTNRFITPAISILILVLMHFFASWWMRRYSFQPIYDGTWFMLYFPFNHVLESSMRLLSFTNVFNHYRFFYYAESEYFGGDHLKYGIVAATVLFILLFFIFIVYWLCADNRVPKCVFETAAGAKFALQIGLKEGLCRQWWTWDLIRRVIILSLSVLGNYDEWIKHTSITVAIFAFLLFHVWAKPYMEVTDAEVKRSTVYVGMVPLLRKRHFCNYLEAAVLVNMILVCMLSCSALQSEASYQRKCLLAFVMVWPSALLGVLMLLKLYYLLVHRLFYKQSDAHVPAVGGEQQPLLRHDQSVSYQHTRSGTGSTISINTTSRPRERQEARSQSRPCFSHGAVLEDTSHIRNMSPCPDLPVENTGDDPNMLP